LTTSATVPSATRSSSASSRGCDAASKRPRARSSARVAEQRVEHHADARERLALERAVRLVRVDDDVGVGQHDDVVDQRGQVVVGDQHVDAARAGVRDAREARDAVVHRHQQVGLRHARRVERARVVGAVVAAGEVDDRRRQAVAVQLAVGHDVRQPRAVGAQHLQAAQRDRAGGGAVAVVVGHDDDALVLLDRVGQQARGLGAAAQRGRRQQLRHRVVELLGAAHAARGEQAREQRMHAGLLQRERGARRDVARVDAGRVAHSASSTGHAATRRARRAGSSTTADAPAARCARARSPHSDRPRRPRRVGQLAQRAGVERVPGLGPRAPVVGQQRRAQAVVDDDVGRQRLVGRLRRAGAASQNELTLIAPRASRASLSGCTYSSICTSLCRRRTSITPGWSLSHRSTLRPITRSIDAVGSSASDGWLTYQRVGAGPVPGPAQLGEQRRERVVQRARLGLVEFQQRRVDQVDLVAADVPVRRRQQAPAAARLGREAVAARGLGGEGQQAVRTGQPRRRASRRSCGSDSAYSSASGRSAVLASSTGAQRASRRSRFGRLSVPRACTAASDSADA
jgi:hypothetical protein